MSSPSPRQSDGSNSRGRSFILASGPVTYFVGCLVLLPLAHVLISPPLRRLFRLIFQLDP